MKERTIRTGRSRVFTGDVWMSISSYDDAGTIIDIDEEAYASTGEARQVALGWLALDWMWTLANNLAIGAALCRAFNLGRLWTIAWTIGEWHPGCQRPAP